VERQPNQPNYGALRDSHQQALDALSNHEQGKQPAREAEIQGPSVQAEQVQQVEHAPAAEVAESGSTRPEVHPGPRPGWTDRGDLVSHQASANEMVKAHHADRQNHAAALDAMNQHIEAPQADKQADRGVTAEPQRTDDIER